MASELETLEQAPPVAAPFAVGRLESLLRWSRRQSLSVYPFVHACCEPELDAALAPRRGLDRLGTALPCTSPRHADVLLVGGTLTQRQLGALLEVYRQMPHPKWVIAFGSCACSGAPYDNYATAGRVDAVLPVDVYVPGCPPRPEALRQALAQLQARIERGGAS
jgi:NADH-quinone oxidoreductase subunit B